MVISRGKALLAALLVASVLTGTTACASEEPARESSSELLAIAQEANAAVSENEKQRHVAPTTVVANNLPFEWDKVIRPAIEQAVREHPIVEFGEIGNDDGTLIFDLDLKKPGLELLPQEIRFLEVLRGELARLVAENLENDPGIRKIFIVLTAKDIGKAEVSELTREDFLSYEGDWTDFILGVRRVE